MKLVDNEYQIEKDDVLNNSEFSESELVDTYGEKLEYYLKVASQRVYSIMYSAYGGVGKERQYEILRYMINNDEKKQIGLREAIIEYIRGAVYTGMDLNQYTKNGGASYSDEVIAILKRYRLYVKATLVCQDEELKV